ncbi:MAG: hypothetical protein CR972_04375 [Candidatus Moraniibacteriota bacterium]|nr:MAG: hypothetical protein CR972_04375 [Candidatus Moranbacteria bacterium]
MEKSISIPTNDGHVIHGTLNWQEPQSKKLIIFVHGFGSKQSRHLFFNGARFFPQNGFTTYRFDLYSPQEKGRNLIDCTITTHATDINTVVDHFCSEYDEVYLVGHSLGGPSILQSAQKVHAVVLWDPSLVLEDAHMDGWVYDDTRNVYVRKRGVEKVMNTKMYDEWKNSNADMIEKMKVPTKIICAGSSPRAERWDAIIDKVAVPYEYSIIDGAGHSFDEEGKEEMLFDETLTYLQQFSA